MESIKTEGATEMMQVSAGKWIEVEVLTCDQCECATGEHGAEDVRKRDLTGEALCLECYRETTAEFAADLADEREFYS